MQISSMLSGHTKSYGDGSDGDATVSSAMYLDSHTGVDDTGFVVKQYRNLNITAAGSILPSRRNKGMFIFCTGDCILDGVLDQSKMGSIAAMPGEFTKVNLRMLPQAHFANYPLAGKLNEDGFSCPAQGALGAAQCAPGTAWALPGVAGINGELGGGGTGTTNPGSGGGLAGAGGRAGPFGGGGGSAGIGYCGTGCTNTSPDAVGPAGGVVSCGHCAWGTCGGAGVPPQGLTGGGYGGNVGPSETGVGGHLWLFVKGVLTVGATGKILSRGARGGQAWASGGGSGGGSITIIYRRGVNLIPGYTIDTSGGLSGINTDYPGHGGAGSLRGPMQLQGWY